MRPQRSPGRPWRPPITPRAVCPVGAWQGMLDAGVLSLGTGPGPSDLLVPGASVVQVVLYTYRACVEGVETTQEVMLAGLL